MLTSKFLKGIMTEAYPVIKRQVEDAKIVSGFRDTVAANGGDWSALKALIKAHVEDTLDETGEGKRVRKILDKADSSNAYAGMLGLIMNEKNFIAGGEGFDPETGEITEPQSGMPLVDSAPDAQGLAEPAYVRDGGVANIKSANINETQSRSTTGSDLTTSPSLNGQVAPPSQAKTSTDGGTTERDIETPADGVTGEASRASVGAGSDASIPVQDAKAMKVNTVATVAAEPAQEAQILRPGPVYAAPGSVVLEHVPPEPIVAHPFAACWPVRDIDVTDGVHEPIVKIGNLILDGRGRYFAARAFDGGKGIDYPTVQYDGTDPLMDCIRWNLASRSGLHPHNLKMIAQKLVKEAPDRAEEIFAAMGIAQEVAA